MPQGRSNSIEFMGGEVSMLGKSHVKNLQLFLRLPEQNYILMYIYYTLFGLRLCFTLHYLFYVQYEKSFTNVVLVID